MKLTSNVDGAAVVFEGAEIVLTVSLTGFENDVYDIEWQSSADGVSFRTVEGASGTQHSFIINDTNAGWLWRVNVKLLEAQAQE